MKTFLPLLLLLSLFPVRPSLAQAPDAQRQKQYNLEKGLALEGYDPISYFDGKPREGRREYTHTHRGVTYRFVSAANAERFKKDPMAYEPAYGGWCAYAMGATGEKVSVDAETYKITGGRLYLFYNKLFTNTLPKWNQDEAALARKADTHWMKFYR